MEVGDEVVLDNGVKGKVISKTWKFKDKVCFSVVQIEDEKGKILKIKIREDLG